MGRDKETRVAYAEIISFINLLPQDKQEKIPKNIIEYLNEEMDKDSKRELTTDIPLENQNLKNATWDLIAILYLKYLCEDEEEKKELEQIYDENEKKYREEMKEKYNENEKKYREEMKEKYNPEKIFKEREKQQVIQNLPIKVQKESIIQKIIKFINKLFHKKNT